MGDPLLNAAMAVHMHAELAAMQARAEQAERDLEITGDARALARFRETERERDALKVANAALSDGVLAYEARVAALEARLAEQAPVVEAAERQAKARPGSGPWLTPEQRGHRDPDHLAMLAEKYPWLRATVDVEKAVEDMLAARSLRGAGEGGGA